MKNNTSRNVLNLALAAMFAAATMQSSSASMLIEYKFDGTGANTGTSGGNTLTIGAGTPAPTFSGPANPNVPGSTGSFDNSALTYNESGAAASTSSVFLATNTSLTFTGWINNQSGAALTGNPRIWDKGANASGGFNLQFADATRLQLVFGNGTSQGIAVSAFNSFGTQNTWEWFGVTLDSTTGIVDFYNLQSGTVTLRNSFETGVIGYANNTNLIRVLNTSGSGNRAYDGYADDLRLFNNVQSVAQMQALVPEPGTWALLTGGFVVLIAARRRFTKTK